MPIDVPCAPASPASTGFPAGVPGDRRRRRMRLAAAGCTGIAGRGAVGAVADRHPAWRGPRALPTQSPLEPRYLRFRPDETQLSGAQDDGRHTYLEFSSPPAGSSHFFDQDGRPLASAAAGRVAAVQGLHAGILVRRADRASFVSQNPRTMTLPPSPLVQTAEHAEARARLENQSEPAAGNAARAGGGTAGGGGGSRSWAGQAVVRASAGLAESAVHPAATLQLPAFDPAAHAARGGLCRSAAARTAGRRKRHGRAPMQPARRPSRSPSKRLACVIACPQSAPSALKRRPSCAASRRRSRPPTPLPPRRSAVSSGCSSPPPHVPSSHRRTGWRCCCARLATPTRSGLPASPMPPARAPATTRWRLARADAVVQILLRRGIASGRIFSSCGRRRRVHRRQRLRTRPRAQPPRRGAVVEKRRADGA